MDANYITDDEAEDDVAERDPSSGWTATPAKEPSDSEGVPTGQTQLDLDADPAATNAPAVIVDEEDNIPDNPVAELLRMHYNFGHAPFSKLQEMAKGK